MLQILVINKVRVLGSEPHIPYQFCLGVPPPPRGMFPAKYVRLSTYTNHRLAMYMIKKNDAKKGIWMKQTVFDYIAYSTSTTTHPTPPSTPNKERQNVSCGGNFLWFVFCSVMNIHSIIRRFQEKSLCCVVVLLLCCVVHFLGRLLVGWTRESGGNQAYYEHSVQ